MNSYILEISKLIRQQELAVLCGAGISRNSGLPLASELERSILKKLLRNKDKDEADEILNSGLPFEAFMESISENSDISNILDIFKEGKPNINHILVAKLAKKGYLKTIFTTNFDMLIERALEKELRRDKDLKVYFSEEQFARIGPDDWGDPAVRIFKIHGSVEDKESIRTTLKMVASKTLSEKRMKLIRYLFSNGKHKKGLILGYSCSDEFDITPQIQSILENQKQIILVDHDEIEKIEDMKVKDLRNPFKKFSGVRIVGDTDKFVKKLWISLRGVMEEEYRLNKFKTEWEKHVDNWADGLGENEGYLKHAVLGRILCRISNFKKAIEYHKKCLEIATEKGDKVVESGCCTSLGIAYYSLGDFEKAIEYHEKSLEIAREIGDKTEESACDTNLGNAYYGLGDLKKAIGYHEKSLEVAKQIGTKAVESACYTNLGIAYYSLGDFKKAIEYHEKSLEIVREIGDKLEESKCYGNLGDAYYGVGDLNKAIDYHQKSLEIAERLGGRVVESKCDTNLGGDYCILGDFKKAIRYYEKSLEIDKEVGTKTGESACYINLGAAYCGLGDFKKAIGYYLKAENIIKEVGQIRHLKAVYNELSLVYEKIGDYNNAKAYKKLGRLMTEDSEYNQSFLRKK